MSEIENKVKHFIAENHLLSDKEKVAVALSGGPDSVCLLLMLRNIDYECVALHCNFQLRGEESNRDERFVRELCEKNGIELHVIKFDTMTYSREQGVSIEMAARDLRYDFFKKKTRELGVEKTAVAHHIDDNNETFILNLTRGTGLRGLCGMRPRNNNIIRPLLCLTREEVEAYLVDKCQSFITDHTNLEDVFSRNKVRLSIIPTLKTINPAVQRNMANTISNLNEAMKIVEASVNTYINNIRMDKDGIIYIDKSKLYEYPSPVTLLHTLLSPFGFNRTQIIELSKGNDSVGNMYESETHKLVVDRNSLVIKDTTEMETVPDLADLNPRHLLISEVVISRNANEAFIDEDKVKNGLRIRRPQKGDSFAPFGMNGKRKLLSDFLTDLKLNRIEKENQLLLVDGEEIVWVVGRRVSELYKIDKDTKNVFSFKY